MIFKIKDINYIGYYDDPFTFALKGSSVDELRNYFHYFFLITITNIHKCWCIAAG